jgi:polyisoprenoid-binding protein YceI
MTEAVSSGEKAAETTRDRYVIDGRSSRFTVRATATGVMSMMGHSPTIGIRDFAGGVKFDPEQLQAGAFRLKIKSASLGVLDDVSDRDRSEMERLMNQEVLETARFPEILYETSRISVTRIGDALFTAALDGTLTLHGVTHNEQVNARVAWMDSMLRASGEFSIKQSNYNIKPVSVAGGALKLKDELQCQFEIVARRQE